MTTDVQWILVTKTRLFYGQCSWESYVVNEMNFQITYDTLQLFYDTLELSFSLHWFLFSLIIKVHSRSKYIPILDRLIYIALPRVRDFKGLSKKSFDKSGNYSIGIKEQIIFPEINYDKIDKVRGMDVSIVTSTNDKNHAFELLKGFNLPLLL